MIVPGCGRLVAPPRWVKRLVVPLIAAALVSPAVLIGGWSVAALDNGRIPASGVLRVSVPEAIGGKTVVGQLTVDQAVDAGYVTAYGCNDGIPTDPDGVGRSDQDGVRAVPERPAIPF